MVSRGNTSRNNTSFKRVVNNKSEKLYVVFSLEYFMIECFKNKPQSAKDWENDKILYSLFEFFENVSKLTVGRAFSDGYFKKYNNNPKTKLKNIPDIMKDQWVSINHLHHQKNRGFGFFENNIFYLVMLDKNHKVFPSKK